MRMNYRLHYAPDNAPLIIRLALEEIGVPYETVLVDRRSRAQDTTAYRALNPAGLIPVLETPSGPIFETAAIGLWLVDQHAKLGPASGTPDRADFLKWLFHLSNTVHADLRLFFYAPYYVGEDTAAQITLRTQVKSRLAEHLSCLNDAIPMGCYGGPDPSFLDIYTCCMLRWMALYPADQDRCWYQLSKYPNLSRLCARLENRESTQHAILAEGLGMTPFTRPQYTNPPEGSAT